MLAAFIPISVVSDGLFTAERSKKLVFSVPGILGSLLIHEAFECPGAWEKKRLSDKKKVSHKKLHLKEELDAQ